jgi:hypothetical protein
MNLYNAAKAHFINNDMSNADKKDLRVKESRKQRRFGQLMQRTNGYE